MKKHETNTEEDDGLAFYFLAVINILDISPTKWQYTTTN